MNKLSSYKFGPDLEVCRILNGMWQVAGGHGYIDREKAVEDMIRYHDSGFTSWDLADIYGPAEDLIGDLRRRLLELRGKDELDRIQALTKWVPRPGKITPSAVSENIQKSLNRMNVSSIDLLQFHWWDYNNPYYMDALQYLTDLRDIGLIKNIGLTNFDTERLQVMIDAWGGWKLFQELLSSLKAIAEKHKVSIANIATRYILDSPAVAGVIIGARLGIVDHRLSNEQTFKLMLDRSDLDAIDVVCKKSNNLFEIIGDCGDEYR